MPDVSALAMARVVALLATALGGAAVAGDARPRAYVVVNATAIPAPLTGGEVGDDAAASTPGDPARGAALAVDACQGCHAPADAASALAPTLAGVARRLEVGALRLAVVNLAIRAPLAEGHAFYDLPPFDPAAAAPAETVLTAEQVEDVVAWLATLTR